MAVVSVPISYSVQSLAALLIIRYSVSIACWVRLYNSIVVKTASMDGTYFHFLSACWRGDVGTWLSFILQERLILSETPYSS